MLITFLFIYCMYVCMYTYAHTLSGSQRAIYKSQFSTFTVWVWGLNSGHLSHFVNPQTLSDVLREWTHLYPEPFLSPPCPYLPFVTTPSPSWVLNHSIEERKEWCPLSVCRKRSFSDANKFTSPRIDLQRLSSYSSPPRDRTNIAGWLWELLVSVSPCV